MNFLKNSLAGYVITVINVGLFIAVFVIGEALRPLDFTSLLIIWGLIGIVSSTLQAYFISKVLKKPEIFNPSLITALALTVLIPIFIYLASVIFSAYIYNEKQG